MKFYHGSAVPLELGTILHCDSEKYATKWVELVYFEVLEKYRPLDKLSHMNAVFMAETEQDVDNLGGDTDYLLIVEPLSEVFKHDQHWCTKMCCLISEEYSVDSQEIKQMCENYWAGLATDEPVWEFLTKQAKVVSCEEY